MAIITVPRRFGLVRARLVDPTLLIPLVAVAVLLGLTALPLAMLIFGSFQVEVARNVSVLSLENYVAAYTNPRTYTTFANSLIFAGGSAFFAFAIGALLAWLVERTNTPGRHYFFALALVPLIIPGVLSTIAWIYLLSPQIGWLNTSVQWLFRLPSPPFNIFGMAGMIWVEALHSSPIAFLLMSSAFKSMDPALEESAMTSGAGTLTTLRRVTLRLMAPGIAASLLILFVRAIEAFEVPALVGLPAKTFVLTSEIFYSLRAYPPDFGLSGALAVGLLLLSAAGVWIYGRLTRRSERYSTVTGKAFRPRQIDLGKWRWLAAGVLLLYFALIVGLPFLTLLWASLLPFFQPPSLAALDKVTLENYRFVINFAPFQTALKNSFLLGLGSATLVMFLTAIISWIVVKTRLPGRRLLDYLAFLPIGIPGLVLGVSIISIALRFPLPIYGTLWVLLFAYMIRYLPYGMRTSSASMVQIHNELEEASEMSGSSWWSTFRRVTLPLLRPGLVAGWIYIFVVSVRELSSSILLYSSQSMVLSILIFDLYESGKSNAVGALAVIMITTLVLVVMAVQKISGRFGIREA